MRRRKGRLSNETFVEYASQGKHVRPSIDRLTTRLLGRHICGCPDESTRGRQGPGHVLRVGNAKVEKFYAVE
jgi:hypothetical protein